MNLADSHLKQLENPLLTNDERVLLRCRQSAEFIHVGQYESAREALSDLWQGIGSRPELKGLTPLVSAEVLLQCGVLSGWLGSVHQISGAQEKAKDLLSEALRKFQSQRQQSKVSEVQYELGICYWREGAYDEARVTLDEARKELKERDNELKAKILIRRTLVEISESRYHDAWNVLKEAEAFFESCSDALKGRWHGQRGLVLRRLATAEGRADYVDRAIVEFTAAIVHYERAKHERYCAINLNNLAMLLYKLGRYREAHQHLEHAVRILIRLNDGGLVAQVNETRARVFVAEHRYQEADGIIDGVVQTFEKGGEYALLADALTIQGVVWARLGVHESSMQVLRHAMNVAQDSGSFSNAGLSALTLIEEHGRERLSETELYDVYARADGLLKDTQDAEEIARLRGCARIVTQRLVGARLSDEDFVLPEVVLAYEAKFIREALEAEQGSVSRAASRLGVRYQSLIHILSARHQDLLKLRTPARARRRSIIRRDSVRKARTAEKNARAAVILHVEDHEVVAGAVKDILEMEGWRVVTCADGEAGFGEIGSKSRYDLLLLDNDLPHVGGLELVRRARQLTHRRRTPIIMLSAGDVEAQAWRAGVDAFLRKPQDIGELAGMVTRLLSKDDYEQ
ncbi:MAG TPA: response regulator [Pyrinomonadaceae bacterium]|jgi:two-component system chemotaxis response regulator CheY|nr:response regulator [Pyrinomonadaceae bacterium]